MLNVLLTKLLHLLVLKSAFFPVVFCLRRSGRGHPFRNRGRGGPTQRSVRDRKAKSVPSRAFLGVDILLTVCKQSLNLEYELRSSLDACSVIQIRKPQKVDSVHLDVTLSVGKTFCHSSKWLLFCYPSATSRWTQSGISLWDTLQSVI